MEIEIVSARIAAQLRRKQYEDENRSIREQLLRSDMIARSQQELALSSAAKNEELRQLAAVAQQKAHEAEDARREVQQLAESIPQIVWAADALGKAAYFNLRWYEYTGFSEAESTGEGWWTAVHEANRDAAKKLWCQAVESGSSYSAEHQIRGEDTKYRWFLARAVPMRDAQGHVVRWFGTCTDIEERKNTEEALRRSEKLAATGRLAAAIAHEINNPLEAVVNLLYIARSVVSTSAGDAAKYLVMAEKELARVAHISKKTLAFYRDTTDPHETDICSLVREVAEVYSAHATSARVEIEGEYNCLLRPKTLPGEIRQVISNVIANAIDASHAEGRLRIRVHDGRDYRTGKRGVRIVVADNGAGISESVRARLFQPFVTTKRDKGTGLGLWVSASIIERHNGSIRVRSVAEGKRSGTCMSIFLPEHSDIRTDADETAELLKAVGRDLLGTQSNTHTSAGD
jgi:PAS domain S-box-containing protein